MSWVSGRFSVYYMALQTLHMSGGSFLGASVPFLLRSETWQVKPDAWHRTALSELRIYPLDVCVYCSKNNEHCWHEEASANRI
jgi:hypothetical protein